VASLALDLLHIGMGAFEREVRLCMIEGLFRNRRNVLCPALMFRVAFLAFPLLLEAPVIALLLIDILARIFMAIETQSCLRRFVKPLMACGTGVFPLGMALDHLTRHQSGFDGVGPGRAGQEEGGQRGESNDDVCDAHDIQKSVHVDADDVKDRTGGQEIDERDVEDVPPREQAFIRAEIGHSFNPMQIPRCEANSFRGPPAKLRARLGSQQFPQFPGTAELNDRSLRS